MRNNSLSRPTAAQIALTLKLVNNPAESTDSGIYLVSIAGGRLQNITPGMPGYDWIHVYSPDGRFIAFHSMQRAGFESDRNRIMLYDRSSSAHWKTSRGLDQTTHHATWSDSGKELFFHSETRGTTQVYRIDLDTAAHATTLRRYDSIFRSSLPFRTRRSYLFASRACYAPLNWRCWIARRTVW